MTKALEKISRYFASVLLFHILKFISYFKIILIFVTMVILIKKTLSNFAEIHPLSAAPLNNWYTIVKAADWTQLADIKKVFNTMDYVGNDRYVFNIKGNDFRLVAMIFFDKRTLFIRFIGTHNEYDKIDCSTI